MIGRIYFKDKNRKRETFTMPNDGFKSLIEEFLNHIEKKDLDTNDIDYIALFVPHKIRYYKINVILQNLTKKISLIRVE